MATICFLTYINRSGSTLLAEKLDGLDGVCSSIEPDIRDGVGTPGGLVLANDEDLDEYLDEIYGSPKFSKWDIERGTLRESLAVGGFPVTFKEILPAILRLSCGGEAKVYVFKNNNYFLFHEILRRMFPGSRFIFIGRDPRGIYNSQKRSVDSKGTPMRHGLVSFAADYLNTTRFIDTCLRTHDYFHHVRYEDLVLDEETVMGDLRRFLGVSGGREGRRESYFERIPEEQRHLHRNIEDGTLKKERILAWKRELEPREIAFLQSALRGLLLEKGYPLVEAEGLSLPDRLAGFGRLLFFLARCRLSRLIRG